MLDLHFLLAERQGFEPRVPRGTTVFKTAAIDHSATSPKLFCKSASFQKRCKDTYYFLIYKFSTIYFYLFTILIYSYKKCTFVHSLI